MALIEEINEKNYISMIKKGTATVDEKIRVLHAQQRNNNINLNLFFDPTIWAYKLLTDKQANSFKLRGFQDMLLNDRHPFILCAAANQAGKTHAACVKVIHHAYFVPNASVLVISRSEPQAIYILDEIKWMLQRANISFETVIAEIDNRSELHIKNHGGKGVSVIRCLPATERVLAYLATLVVCDEIGFWKIEREDPIDFFERVIISRIQETVHWKPKVNGVDISNYFTMGQVFCISSTNAQQGIMWSLWNNSDYHHYQYCWLANPLNTIERYNELKKSKSADVFDSVYAAVFSSATGGFITAKEYDDAVKGFVDKEHKAIPSLTVPLYFGGDIAGEDTVSRDVDSTVLFGGIKIREDKIDKVKIEYSNEFPLRSKKALVYDELARFKNIAQFAYDKMGVGDSVKNDLMDRHILAEYQIEALSYSLPNKSDVYYNLKHLFEQRKILLPPGLNKLREQLLGLRFERTQGGHMTKPQIKIHHEREGLHDDWADALANCCWATMRGSAVPVVGNFIPYGKIKGVVKKKEDYKNKGNYVPCPKCDEYFWSNQKHECITI